MGWYHLILQDAKNSPQTWPEKGLSFPSVVRNLPGVAAWSDRSLLIPAFHGVIVKKSGFHL